MVHSPLWIVASLAEVMATSSDGIGRVLPACTLRRASNAHHRRANPHLAQGHPRRSTASRHTLSGRGCDPRHGRGGCRRRHPASAGELDAQFQRAGGRSGTGIPEALCNSRLPAARQTGQPRADRELETAARHAGLAPLFQQAAQPDLAHGRYPGLALAGSRESAIARGAARGRLATFARPDRSPPSGIEAGGGPYGRTQGRQRGRGVSEHAGADGAREDLPTWPSN